MRVHLRMLEWNGVVIQINIKFICMSNLGNYSPYNKTYKFILFQNQAYHERNKRNASPCIRSNVNHSMSRLSPAIKNPQNFELLLSNLQSPRHSLSRDSKAGSSRLFQKRREIQRARISDSKRVIHKNQSYQKFRSQRVSEENMSIVSRILGSQCQVISKNGAQKAFQRHMRYRDIRRRYNQLGERKDCISLGDSKLLCPTLMQFQKTGLGNKFIEKDLSMSIKPSTSQSMRKSFNSHLHS